jgi:hypothetical protein
VLRYIFKINLIIILFYACDDIARDNLLDPQNPSSYRSQIIAIEAFVNTCDSLPYSYNQDMLIALHGLENEYDNKITIVEYHRNTGVNQEYIDQYHLPEAENLYEKYIDIYGGPKGVPDVFFNVRNRVQGVYNLADTEERLEKELQSLLNENSYFTIEPEITKRDNEIDINVTIARLGSKNARDIKVKVIIIERMYGQYIMRVVRKILVSSTIDLLAHGGTKEVHFDPVPMDDQWGSDLEVVCNVISEDELDIYQSIKKEIK